MNMPVTSNAELSGRALPFSQNDSTDASNSLGLAFFADPPLHMLFADVFFHLF
jgi:hypothetical protein